MQNKLVALIDMDCFYCQVETRLNPSLIGKPLAVVQYNTWKGGGIIAVNYEARRSGVTRHMRGEDAQKQCPQIELVSVPEVRGKADLSKYRNASREVMTVLCKFCACVEKASIDEAYLDLTDTVQTTPGERVTSEKLKSTYVVGYNSDYDGTRQWLSDIYTGGINDSSIFNIARAASLVDEIRATILSETGFHCSAGISHNKILAKLACGLHKPKCQTVLPLSSVPILYEKLPLKKIRNLGGKFGDAVKEQLNVTTVGQVSQYSLNYLQQMFGCKSGLWLYNIARGIDFETVKVRTISKSIGCCKNFKGYAALTSNKEIKHWLRELCAEIYDRAQEDLLVNKRRATLLTVSAHQISEKSSVFSRSTPLNSYDMDEMITNSFALLCRSNRAPSECGSWSPPLKFLGLSVGKFVDVTDSCQSLLHFFKPLHDAKCTTKQSSDTAIKLESKTPQSCFKNTNFVANLMSFESPNNNDSFANYLPNVKDLDDAEILNYSNSFFYKYFGSVKTSNTANDNINYANVNSNISDDVCSDRASTDVISEIKDSLYAQRYSSNTKFQNNNDNGSNSHRPTAVNIRVEDCQDLNEVHKISGPANNMREKEKSGYGYGCIENELMEHCDQCDRMIPLESFLEHLDYHAAHKLHQQLNVSNNVLRSNDCDSKNHKSSLLPNNFTVPSTFKCNDKRKYKKSVVENRTNSSKKDRSIATFFHFKQQQN